MNPIFHLRLKKKITAGTDEVLRVHDLCHAVADERFLDVMDLPVLKTALEHGNAIVIDVLDVVRVIQERHPQLDIRAVGPAQTLVEVRTPGNRPNPAAAVFVWLLLFVGSGLAIMNFHADVSMQQVHERIFYLITGVHVKKPLLLQVAYSLGIGTGMVLFFNHLFRRRFNEEPSPMELEVFLYQETIDQYLINDEKQKPERNRHVPPA
jgi:stage V sporulation protein AA